MTPDLLPSSPEYFACFQAAGRHLEQHLAASGLGHIWLKADPLGPYYEHFSFRLGTQVFFIRLMDVDGRCPMPGSLGEMLEMVRGYDGFGAVLPMRKGPDGWQCVLPGWGLMACRDGRPVRPEDVADCGPKAMTSWDMHGVAVRFICEHMAGIGVPVVSACFNPEVLPAVWLRTSERTEWITVITYPLPGEPVEPPALGNLGGLLVQNGFPGHYALVGMAAQHGGIPRRGQRLTLQFSGIQPVAAPPVE